MVMRNANEKLPKPSRYKFFADLKLPEFEKALCIFFCQFTPLLWQILNYFLCVPDLGFQWSLSSYINGWQRFTCGDQPSAVFEEDYHSCRVGQVIDIKSKMIISIFT